MPLTPEQIEKLKERILEPKEVEYKSAAGTRRRENQDVGDLYEILKKEQGAASDRPTFRRASHSRGFRK